MTRKFFISILIILISAVFCGFRFDFYGFMGSSKMAEYNSAKDVFQKIHESLGYKTDMYGINYNSGAGLKIGFDINAKWGIYVRTDYVFSGRPEDRIYYETGELYQTGNAAVDSRYIGAGAKMYFKDFIQTASFNSFVSLDAGALICLNSHETRTWYEKEGGMIDNAYSVYSGSAFSACVEAGADYFLTENYGFFAAGGYRFINGRYGGRINSLDVKALDNEETYMVPDYTGIYAKAGIFIVL
ncbi:MAG: hypothetical protein ACLFP1_05150 [Candidatus Goldiibacteriota bacterium]